MFYLKIFQIIKFSTLVLCQSEENEKNGVLIQKQENDLNREYEPTFTFGPSDSEDDDSESQVNLPSQNPGEIVNDNTNEQDLNILEITYDYQNDLVIYSRNESASFHRSPRMQDLTNSTGENPTTSRNGLSNHENGGIDTISDSKLNDEVKGGNGKWFVKCMQRLGCMRLPDDD